MSDKDIYQGLTQLGGATLQLFVVAPGLLDDLFNRGDGGFEIIRPYLRASSMRAT